MTDDTPVVAEVTEQSDDKPRPTGPRSRRVLLVTIGLLVAAAIGGLIWFARFAPLTTGSSWGPTISSGDAWSVDHAFFMSDNVVLARNEHLASLDFTVSIRNESGFPIRILEPAPLDDEVDVMSCFWNPIGMTFAPPSWYDDADIDLEPPFTVRAHDEVAVAISGVIGSDEGGPCTMQALTWGEVEVPIRYSVFGIPRIQQLPLGLTIGISDEPEDWLEMDVRKLDSD